MLSKHAFHLSLPVECAKDANKIYIFNLFGFTTDSQGHNVKSTSVEYYDVANDSWSTLNLNNSTVHIYNFINFLNNIDSHRTPTEPNQALLKKSIVSLKDIIYFLQGKSPRGLIKQDSKF